MPMSSIGECVPEVTSPPPYHTEEREQAAPDPELVSSALEITVALEHDRVRDLGHRGSSCTPTRPGKRWSQHETGYVRGRESAARRARRSGPGVRACSGVRDR